MRLCPIVLAALAYASVCAGCAAVDSLNRHSTMAESSPGVVVGYLGSAALPDSASLLPAPPVPGSAAQALDAEVNQRALALRGSERWKQATLDADLTFPEAAGTFSCALGAPITEQDTPHLYTLLYRTLADASNSTDQAKQLYQRTRPFLLNGQAICTPQWQTHIASTGSYPSGHSSVGWAWALILSELAPERGDAILARGLAYGESRIICNVHWQSDVVAGRVMGAGTVARLHADPTFRSDLEAAKSELAALRGRGAKPQRDCTAEAAALGRQLQGPAR